MKNGLLTIPDDGALAPVLGGAVQSRTVIHEWPLSRVERITAENGHTAILKTQLTSASAERAFLRKVRDPALPVPIADSVSGDCDWMLLPDYGSACEDWSGFTDEAIRERVRELCRIIARLDGDAPVFFDLSTPEKLADACRSILPTLADAGWSEDARAGLLGWAEGEAKVCFESPAALLHGDMKGENVIHAAGGVILLDWQRPIRGPEPLEEELALLLAGRESRGPFARLAAFTLGYWYAWAYRTCLPYPFVCGMAGKYLRGAMEDRQEGRGKR
ncbi:MAG: phosphotransferase [Clostridia bacterium]|nr:phosphotransferase [Clostridia bacterium]